MRLALSTLVFLACFHHAGTAEAEAEFEALPLVDATTTWSDLAKQPPITLANGSTVRLGIETLEAPAQRGALIYLLGEGEIVEEKNRSGEPLGPLTVELLQPPDGKKLEMQWSLFDCRIVGTGPITTLRLWTRLINAQAGTTVTWLARLNQQPVARIRFHATTEPWQPWSPLCRPTQKLDALQAGDGTTQAASTGPEVASDRDYGAVALIGPDAFAARPMCDGRFPWLELTGRLAERPALAAASLPQLDPATATVAAWRSGDRIHLAMPQPIGSGHLRERVLARWWLNGKAVLPAQGQGGSEDFSGATQITSHLIFSFAGLAPGFTAPSGSEIAVEFLVGPQGWEGDDGRLHAMHAQLAIHTESALRPGPQRSNRLCWTLPK